MKMHGGGQVPAGAPAFGRADVAAGLLGNLKEKQEL